MPLAITPATWQLWCFAVLSLSMVIAIVEDTRERRIPNVLVVVMLCSGIALNTLGPDNDHGGLFSHFPGALGASGALLGALTGFALFLPLYLLRATGAGDVKLMAALGSFAGPMETLNVALSILIMGGALAVLRMLWTRKSRLVLSNVVSVLSNLAGASARQFDPVTQSADRMPYALAFAGGLLAYGYWRFIGGVPVIVF